jgi:hypothetical protein
MIWMVYFRSSAFLSKKKKKEVNINRADKVHIIEKKKKKKKVNMQLRHQLLQVQ